MINPRATLSSQIQKGSSEEKTLNSVYLDKTHPTQKGGEALSADSQKQKKKKVKRKLQHLNFTLILISILKKHTL